MARFEAICRLLRRNAYIGPARSATEAYRAMLSEEIAPALHDLGLESSGEQYELPNDAYWALIGFQYSRKTITRKKLRFTVNLLVASRKLWAEKHAADPDLYPERPDASALRVEFWWSRLGELLPDRTDRWWAITPDRLTSPVAAEVVAAIREHGLPAMREQMQ